MWVVCVSPAPRDSGHPHFLLFLFHFLNVSSNLHTVNLHAVFLSVQLNELFLFKPT